jgi:alanyl-tRNA synthetase
LIRPLKKSALGKAISLDVKRPCLSGAENGRVALFAKVQAGKIIQTIAPIVGGKGGGKPDNARGGGKDVGKIDEALAKVKTLLG